MTSKKEIEKEYDEDLAELMPEEDEINELREEKYIEGSEDLTKILTDTDIEKNISSFLTLAGIVKWLMIIVGIITFIVSLASYGGFLTGLIMLTIFIVYGFIASILLKWFAYVLKCLQDIKNK